MNRQLFDDLERFIDAKIEAATRPWTQDSVVRARAAVLRHCSTRVEPQLRDQDNPPPTTPPEQSR